jgi:tRNA (cmo5U34)-methyltransferase
MNEAKRGRHLRAARPKTDAIYAEPKPLVTDFRFDAETTAVFDDMLHRSVPLYDEIQRMVMELAGDFAADGSNVYDLGCSTGATLLQLATIERDVTLIGVDSSAAMLARAEATLRAANVAMPFKLYNQDLHQGLVIENASVVVMSLTLQFVRPLHRERLLRTLGRLCERAGLPVACREGARGGDVGQSPLRQALLRALAPQRLCRSRSRRSARRGERAQPLSAGG